MVWQPLGVTVEEGWGGREEDVEKLGIGGTNGRRSRTGRQGKSHSRTSLSISRQVPPLPVRYDCKVWPASVQLHAPPSPAECETGQSDSVVASYMSKIASECSSLCCCTRLVKRKNIRSGQASPGMERALSRAEREQGSPCIDSIREDRTGAARCNDATDKCASPPWPSSQWRWRRGWGVPPFCT